jgi:hypothetical protein
MNSFIAKSLLVWVMWQPLSANTLELSKLYATVTIINNFLLLSPTPFGFLSDANVSVMENQTGAITLVTTQSEGVTYEIEGGQSDAFEINSTTGVITFKEAPDFETLALYTFQAIATNSQGEEIIQEISITIVDVADTQLPKKTGQIKSYDGDGVEISTVSARDDGHYQSGISASYTRDDTTHIVTDHVTNLQWQDSAPLVQKPWLLEAYYQSCQSNTSTYPPYTGDAKADDTNCTQTTGDTAMSYCSNLLLEGGGWRLPTLRELLGLVDYSQTAPLIDAIFQQRQSSYWSSTELGDEPTGAWRVDLNETSMRINELMRKNGSYYVRCVRTGEE